MKLISKLWLLGLLTLTAFIVVFTLKPISQDPSFHNFADHRAFGGIPNFWNVMSNIPFLIIGVAGLRLLRKAWGAGAILVVYGVLFAGILLTSLGSAYYHYDPNNDSLIWDRIPMTIVFMSLLSATVAELIDMKLGILLLLPLVLIGVSSVLWWHYTETLERGDLRLYGFVQYYPMLFIPLIMILFRSPTSNKGMRSLILAVAWYVVAKLLEKFDSPVYSTLHFISGHSLKHLAAAVSTWYLVKLFEQKHIKKGSYTF
ncbi:MAG TPA: ceramidase domain-containing protein [Puia sp.]|nr:ceramidase domain-containing protein [Puia sp.]